MFWIVAATIMVSLVTGAHGNCSREGTKLECTGTFKNIPFALKTDVKVCQNPVKTDIEFKILNRIFSKHYTGDGDILLRGFSVDQSERKAYLLNVNVKPLSNGDRKIRYQENLIQNFCQILINQICMKEKSFGFQSTIRITVLAETVIKPDCISKETVIKPDSSASSIWWNSQTLAIKITTVAVASLLLIILILSILYCCLRHQNSKGQEVVEDKLPVVEEKGAVAEKQPVDVDSKKSKFPEPTENQFKYTLHVNDVA